MTPRYSRFRRVVSFGALTCGMVAACSGSQPSYNGLDDGNTTNHGGKKSDGGSSSTGGGTDDNGTGSLGSSGGPGDSGSNAGCVNLQCQQHSCSGGATTNISGVVYDPAGKNPLYNVVVYVPNTKPDALKTGASCDSCGALYTGKPVVSALTDTAGKFTLTNAPDGPNIPLVIQIGKWRKQITIPNVALCQDNAQPARSLTLPKNHSEGDIPGIAISTGGADSLECLLRRIGLDATEYGPGPSGQGRIHIFSGTPVTAPDPLNPFGTITLPVPDTSPASPQSATSLWTSQSSLMPYDILLLSCEGQETQGMMQQSLVDYTAAGGRVFASHFHYAWLNSGPFGNANPPLAAWKKGANPLTPDPLSASIVTTLPNGQPFPKGQALQSWLGNVGALQGGRLPIAQPKHNSDVGPANTASQAWITASGTATEYFTFNTPLNISDDKQCGRVVYSDLHVGGAQLNPDYGSALTSGSGQLITPDGCTDADLSPQEKALEFMLFDLSSCVTPDGKPPPPPPPPVR